MSDFLTKTNCDRCGAKLTARIMSRFSTDCLCMACEAEERHEEYEPPTVTDIKPVTAVVRGKDDSVLGPDDL